MVLFSACTKPLKFKGEYVDPQLVVNCIAVPGEPIKAVVYKSDFVFDTITDYTMPEGAQAFLFVNGVSKGEMQLHGDTSYYDYLNTNLRYYITWTIDGKTNIYTNVPELSKETTGKDIKGIFENYGKYIYYCPYEIKYETNILIKENVVRSILKSYSYAYPDQINRQIADAASELFQIHTAMSFMIAEAALRYGLSVWYILPSDLSSGFIHLQYN